MNKLPRRVTQSFTMTVVAAVMLSTAAGCSIGLSGSSTCSQYMEASQEAQMRVVSKLASEYRKGVWATPLGFPGVAYYCASHPKTTLDQFFAKASNY